MTKQTKTSTTAGARALARKIRTGAMAGFVMAALLAATGCPTEVEYKEVPTYPEITVPVRLWTKKMYVKCPGDLIGESYTKVHDAASAIEEEVPDGTLTKNQIISILSNKAVLLEVKKGDNSELKEASDSYTMSVGYERLISNNTDNPNNNTVVDELLFSLCRLYDRYVDEVKTQAKMTEKLSDAKNIVRASFGKTQGANEK